MRILNRPMFKYGGPIKEGVMSGMRDGGRIGFKDGTNKKIFGFEIPGTGIALDPATNKPYDPKYIKEMLKKERDKMTNVMSWMFPGMRAIKGAGWSYKAGMPAIKKLFQGPVSKSKELQKYTGPVTRGSDKWFGNIFRPAYQGVKESVKGAVAPLKDFKTAIGLGIPAGGYGLAKGYGAWKKRQTPDAPDLDGTGTETETTSRWDDTAPIITDSMRDKLAKDAQNKRLKSYLDMMGYDSAKKTAMSDALIDASALVQDATTEAGSIKKADWGKLINKAIQTTSKRLDKPAQIREAVGLMSVKAAIEKDMMESKGGALKQNAKDLVAAGVYKTEKEAMSHLGKVGSFEDTMAALASKTGKVTGDMIKVAWISDQKKPPRDHFKSTDEVYKNFKEKMEDAGNDFNIELEFVKQKIDDRQPGDAFVVDDTLVIVNSDGSLDYKWK
jgi:hypothetical protein